MSIIVLRIIYFAIVLCVHVTVLLFYIKRWFTNLFLFHFQTKIVIRMHMRTRGHQTVVTETSKMINFWGRCLFITWLYTR